MKVITITLLCLQMNGEIKTNTITTLNDCETWFKTHVVTVHNENNNLMSNQYYHQYNNEKIVGYVCYGN
jgi:hypothetical protein